MVDGNAVGKPRLVRRRGTWFCSSYADCERLKRMGSPLVGPVGLGLSPRSAFEDWVANKPRRASQLRLYTHPNERAAWSVSLPLSHSECETPGALHGAMMGLGAIAILALTALALLTLNWWGQSC